MSRTENRDSLPEDEHSVQKWLRMRMGLKYNANCDLEMRIGYGWR
jgi:hypothetical protein